MVLWLDACNREYITVHTAIWWAWFVKLPFYMNRTSLSNRIWLCILKTLIMTIRSVTHTLSLQLHIFILCRPAFIRSQTKFDYSNQFIITTKRLTTARVNSISFSHLDQKQILLAVWIPLFQCWFWRYTFKW